MKRNFIVFIMILFIINNLFAEKAKILIDLKFNQPVKYYTYWDPNEGISPGIDILIAKNDNEFYGYCYNSNTWYHFVHNEYEEIINYTSVPGSSTNGQPIYFYNNNILVVGIINYGPEVNNLHLHINKNGITYDINESLKQYTYIQSECSLFFSDDVLFLITEDNEFVIIELKQNQTYNIIDINDSKNWITENNKKFGINYIDGIIFWGDYTFLPFSKQYFLNNDKINILNESYRQNNSIEELGYIPIGKDSVGLDYFRLLKYDGDNNIEYSIAVYNSWSNEIIIYDDFEKNDWNPPKNSNGYFIGVYPWTVGLDGNIYFLDADTEKKVYQIKSIQNRWYNDFRINKGNLGYFNTNSIPLYSEKNKNSNINSIKYCNDNCLIKEKDSEWCYVNTVGGYSGWVETKYITVNEDNPNNNNANSDSSKNTKISKTNVSINKKMICNDNLRLRAEEATSSSIITTMAKGTNVKILKLGKAEVIDGINSNWVQVEILKGGLDKDGNPIKTGTVGWCYGGYLE